MIKKKYIYWKDDDTWLGYLEEFPDYWTQGETKDELRKHLVDLYKELTSGTIPNVRKMAELDTEVALLFPPDSSLC
jgi:predicted RNase H-like HicB family nuclease